MIIKHCLLKNKIILKSQTIFKTEVNGVFSEEMIKIVLSSTDDKRLQAFDRITSYPYGILLEKFAKPRLQVYINHLFWWFYQWK